MITVMIIPMATMNHWLAARFYSFIKGISWLLSKLVACFSALINKHQIMNVSVMQYKYEFYPFDITSAH